MEFSGKIALVTGASRGVGRAVAERLGAAGAQVVAVARTTGGLEEMDDAIKSSGGLNAVLVPLDIRDDEGLARMGAAIHERWGRLDVRVHTAVHCPMLGPIEHIEPDELDNSISVNVRATQRLIRVVDPLLRAAPAGRVAFAVDTTETTGFNGAYVATKAAQTTLFSAWAQGIGRASPVKVLNAHLPPMRSALRARWHPGEDTGTLAAPSDVADKLVAALAADKSGSVDLT